MSQFDQFMGGSFDAAAEVFGTVEVEFDGEAAPVKVDWNQSETREELDNHGRIIGVTATILVSKSRLVNPPRDGQRVTRAGVSYFISGTIGEDAQTYTLALDSTDVPQS